MRQSPRRKTGRPQRPSSGMPTCLSSRIAANTASESRSVAPVRRKFQAEVFYANCADIWNCVAASRVACERTSASYDQLFKSGLAATGPILAEKHLNEWPVSGPGQPRLSDREWVFTVAAALDQTRSFTPATVNVRSGQKPRVSFIEADHCQILAVQRRSLNLEDCAGDHTVATSVARLLPVGLPARFGACLSTGASQKSANIRG